MSEKTRLDYLWQLYPNTFRHDVGSGYTGGKEYRNKDGDLVVINPKRIRYGLTKGAGDLIGWTETVITTDMVGKKVAVFTSIEDKSKTDKIGQEQIIWLLNILNAGGIAKVYREGVELTLEEILSMPRRKRESVKDRI